MKVILLGLVVLSFISCSTMDAVQMLADASRSSSSPDATASAPPPSSGDSTASLSKQAWAQYANPAPSGKTFPKSGDQTALKSGNLQVGEWAAYRHLRDGKVDSIIKMAIVGKDGDAWIFEFAGYHADSVSIIQEAVTGLETVVQTGNSSQAKVSWIKVMDKDGKVNKLDGAMLGVGGAAYSRLLTANAADYSGQIVDGGAVTVPAGTFLSTWKVESQVQSQNRTSTHGVGWVTSQVPLWHLIKAVSDDGKSVLELVGFGMSGYQSDMPK